MDKQARARLYEDAYLADRGFEREMIAGRRRVALEVLRRRAPARVLEIGCGTDPLYEAALGLPNAPTTWVIVEPGERFAEAAERAGSKEVELHVIQGFFEDRVSEVLTAAGTPPDMVVCLGVLQSIEGPEAWLGVIREVLTADGELLLVVPNALSLHRRLGRTMGLITDEQQLSDRDRQGYHWHVFTLETLRATCQAAGFAITEEGGHTVKPFTHQQMDQSREVLTPEILDGLWKLGRELPDLASEIYVVGKAT